MIKKRNKQQSLAGRIDKLGGPEFENHCFTPSFDETAFLMRARREETEW